MGKGLRRASRLTLAGGIFLLGGLAPINGAGALQHETVKYDPSSGQPYSYHADVVMAPTDGGTITDPDTCAAVTWCTMVPLDITPLARGEDQDWLVELDVAWNDEPVETPNNVAGTQQSNDLDVYLYYWGPLVDADGNPEMNEDGTQAEGYVESGRSAGGKSPEILKLFRPTEREYFLVVINFVGVNRGFDIDFTFTDTSFGGLGDYVNDKPPAPAVLPSNDDRLSYGDEPAKPFTAPPPKIATPSAFQDTDFGFAASVPEDLLDAEGPTRGSLFADDVKAPPADVGGGTLVLWLGLLPLVLLAGAVAFFVKQRPSALSVRFPVRRAPVVTEPVTE